MYVTSACWRLGLRHQAVYACVEASVADPLRSAATLGYGKRLDKSSGCRGTAPPILSPSVNGSGYF